MPGIRDGQCLIGINAHLPYIQNWDKFIGRVQALNPASMTAIIDNLNDIGMIERLRMALPNATIVARLYHPQDGEFHMPRHDSSSYVAAPLDVINWLEELSIANQVINILNEPGTVENNPRLVAWLLEIMVIATKRFKNLCVGNFSVGTPGDNGNSAWIAAFDLLLRGMENSNHFLGLHEYLPGEPYRVGRLVWMVNRCKQIGVTPPRVIVTEYGIDNPAQGDPRTGYKSWGLTGKEYALMLIDAAKRHYVPLAKEGVFHGANVYVCGHRDDRWKPFDIEHDDDFWNTLIGFAPRHKSVVPVKPPPLAIAPQITEWEVVKNLVSNMDTQMTELKKILGLKG